MGFPQSTSLFNFFDVVTSWNIILQKHTDPKNDHRKVLFRSGPQRLRLTPVRQAYSRPATHTAQQGWLLWILKHPLLLDYHGVTSGVPSNSFSLSPIPVWNTYVGRQHADHLRCVLNEHYEMSEYWEGKKLLKSTSNGLLQAAHWPHLSALNE